MAINNVSEKYFHTMSHRNESSGIKLFRTTKPTNPSYQKDVKYYC